MRLFLGANVLFTAAHNPGGKAALVTELEAQGFSELYSSHYAVEEAHRNLERKFPHCLDDLTKLQQGIRLVEHRADLAFPDRLAPKDRPIFQAALACRATHLLTGDLKDFGLLMNQPDSTFDVRIQTVAELLSEIG